MKSPIKSRAKNFDRRNFDLLVRGWPFPTMRAVSTTMTPWLSELGGNRQTAVTQLDGGKARAHLMLTAGSSPDKSVRADW